MEDEKFDLWCLIELFGHQRIAGRCTEQNIAGTNMLRVDVPETTLQPTFTRFLSAGSIYAINPITEKAAIRMAENLNVTPITPWDIREMMNKQQKALDSGNHPDFD